LRSGGGGELFAKFERLSWCELDSSCRRDHLRPPRGRCPRRMRRRQPAGSRAEGAGDPAHSRLARRSNQAVTIGSYSVGAHRVQATAAGSRFAVVGGFRSRTRTRDQRGSGAVGSCRLTVKRSLRSGPPNARCRSPSSFRREAGPRASSRANGASRARRPRSHTGGQSAARRSLRSSRAAVRGSRRRRPRSGSSRRSRASSAVCAQCLNSRSRKVAEGWRRGPESSG
jgi:hypothetical protein